VGSGIPFSHTLLPCGLVATRPCALANARSVLTVCIYVCCVLIKDLSVYYNIIYLPAGQNIFMSPISISVALAMTYLGAGGETKAQMRQVLHFNDVEENQLHQAFDDIRTALSQSEEAYRRHMAAQLGYGDPNSVPEDLQDALNKPYQLYMANRLFGEQSYTFLAEFLTAGRTHYGAELEEVDFRYRTNLLHFR